MKFSLLFLAIAQLNLLENLLSQKLLFAQLAALAIQNKQWMMLFRKIIYDANVGHQKNKSSKINCRKKPKKNQLILKHPCWDVSFLGKKLHFFQNVLHLKKKLVMIKRVEKKNFQEKKLQ